MDSQVFIFSVAQTHFLLSMLAVAYHTVPLVDAIQWLHYAFVLIIFSHVCVTNLRQKHGKFSSYSLRRQLPGSAPDWPTRSLAANKAGKPAFTFERLNSYNHCASFFFMNVEYYAV